MTCQARDKELRGQRDREALQGARKSRAVSAQAARKALRKLQQLDAAEEVTDMMAPPGNRLHKLSGDREGQWSVSVDRQYRICFRFNDGNAHDVEATDYH